VRLEHVNHAGGGVNGRSNYLADLAGRISTEHAAVVASGWNAVTRAIAAGGMLNEAKERVGHGGFERFCREECGISPRTARDYMALTEGRETIETANRQRAAEMSIRAALRLLKPTKPRKKPDGPRQKKPKVYTGALNSLAWSEATPAERTAFLANVGVKSIWDALSPSQRQAIIEYALNQTTEDAEIITDVAA
jgi:hypothetical protein